MKDLLRIEATWTKFDLALERELAIAADVGKTKLREQQVINDQAYFLLCWGQLEVEVDNKCRDVVGRRRIHTDWQVRRGWDLYNPDDRRFSGLSFENRARLVLDGQAGRRSPYAVTIKHDGTRNEIAHGRLRLTRVDVSAFVEDCFVIRSALHRAT